MEDRKNDLAQIKKDLLTKRDELITRIEKIDQDFKNGRTPDPIDQATERENDDVLSELKDTAEFELSLVNEALHRIDEGKYGICSICERPINPKRLKAVPYTTQCIQCATRG